ncbi:MAG: helix-turn-helix domain-containing protein [Chloroflexota bacterium]|nr:helix-turn-helix domain-containing protein [Chloroflexota bacterium]
MPAMPQSTLAHLENFGCASWYGQFMSMDRTHQHHEIELNWIETGALTYFIAGTEVTIPARQLALFWGSIPHRVIGSEGITLSYWMTIPLGTFLQWTQSTALWQDALKGSIVFDLPSGESALDHLNFQRWHQDLQTRNEDMQRIVLMEVEARLARMALNRRSETIPVSLPHPIPHLQRRRGNLLADAMAQYIHSHYQEPIRVQDIAASVNLHPNYAMTLFKSNYGISIVDTVTQYRIAHAQRLLLTTDTAILHIAMDAGFGSLSQFYSVFERYCGQPPARYRDALRRSE